MTTQESALLREAVETFTADELEELLSVWIGAGCTVEVVEVVAVPIPLECPAGCEFCHGDGCPVLDDGRRWQTEGPFATEQAARTFRNAVRFIATVLECCATARPLPHAAADPVQRKGGWFVDVLWKW